MSNKPDYLVGGLERGRYQVTKTDGSPVDPDAEYFVIRLDTDPYARSAVEAYLSNIYDENTQLARDLEDWLEETLPEFQQNELDLMKQDQTFKPFPMPGLSERGILVDVLLNTGEIVQVYPMDWGFVVPNTEEEIPSDTILGWRVNKDA